MIKDIKNFYFGETREDKINLLIGYLSVFAIYPALYYWTKLRLMITPELDQHILNFFGRLI